MDKDEIVSVLGERHPLVTELTAARGSVSQKNRPSPLAHFFGLRAGALVHLGPTLEAVAARAPEGADAAQWALSVALVRGTVLSVRLARWDAETETVHDDGPVVTAGPWHQAAGEGSAWAVLDMQGGEVFGCWHADELARWLVQAVEQGPALTDDGRVWAYRTTPPAELERMRLHARGGLSTLVLEAFLLPGEGPGEALRRLETIGVRLTHSIRLVPGE